MLRWVDPNDSGEDHHMAIDDVRVLATAAGASPMITVDTSFNFGNLTVNTTSAIRQYPVSGSNLVEGIGVKAPDGFQVALSAGGSYSDSINLPAGGGTVYLRFAPVAVAAYSGQVTIAVLGPPTNWWRSAAPEQHLIIQFLSLPLRTVVTRSTSQPVPIRMETIFWLPLTARIHLVRHPGVTRQVMRFPAVVRCITLEMQLG
jgi:hypothetical protein